MTKKHLLMISLGSDLFANNKSRSVNRHILYAKASNFTITIISLCPARLTQYIPQSYAENIVNVYPICANNHFILLIQGLWKSINIVRRQNVDLIYTQDPFATALIGSLLRKIFRIPLIIGNHSSFTANPFWISERPIYFRLLRFIMKINIRNADAWRVNNVYERKKYVRYFGIPQNRIFVNNTLVDYSKFSQPLDPFRRKELRTNLSIPLDAVVLVWVGRPVKVKRLDFLLKVFQKSCELDRRLHLLVIGDFSSSHAMLSAFKNSPFSESITILPNGIPNEFLPDYYRASDMYVHSSAYEGFGVVLVEASLCELPLISTINDGSRQIIVEDENGFLVPQDDVSHYVSKILLLSRNKSLRQKMGANAHALAYKNFDYDQNLRRRSYLWNTVAVNGYGSNLPIADDL